MWKRPEQQEKPLWESPHSKASGTADSRKLRAIKRAGVARLRADGKVAA
jgi:hypothetical protein